MKSRKLQIKKIRFKPKSHNKETLKLLFNDRVPCLTKILNCYRGRTKEFQKQQKKNNIYQRLVCMTGSEEVQVRYKRISLFTGYRN